MHSLHSNLHRRCTQVKYLSYAVEISRPLKTGIIVPYGMAHLCTADTVTTFILNTEVLLVAWFCKHSFFTEAWTIQKPSLCCLNLNAMNWWPIPAVVFVKCNFALLKWLVYCWFSHTLLENLNRFCCLVSNWFGDLAVIHDMTPTDHLWTLSVACKKVYPPPLCRSY